MNLNPSMSGTQEFALDALAAELAAAAYRVALCTRTNGTWLDLELDLWKTLADKLQTVEGG